MLAAHGITYQSARQTGQWPVYTMLNQAVTATTLRGLLKSGRLAQMITPEALAALTAHYTKNHGAI
jgi:hypothetical protein